MSIAEISSAHIVPINAERLEGARPDHDNDGDDASPRSPVQASPPPGTGTIVDKTI